MVWILHAIFLNEGRLAWQRRGMVWDSLAHLQQWKAAWIYGPRELWHTLSLVDARAFGLSVILMGLTVLLGVIRWRMVLGIQGLFIT
ncbi:MAG: hypothetical protein M1608_08105, partial [Candidatus Omnitrophica bacterium]|nr:hypothetical protein [Candidatus Omnitrophota bacterium]